RVELIVPGFFRNCTPNKNLKNNNDDKMKKSKKNFLLFFNRFSAVATKATGGASAFVIATLFIIIWAITGPLFKFSDTWQLVINTSTTIITFLMVFIIQHSQNKDTLALQLKLNELIAANSETSNRLISVEDFTEEELEVIKKFYAHLAKSAKNDKAIFATHSLDEAKKNALQKKQRISNKPSK
ncbi:MAG: low affinity iron permease family protein, partial [Ginsengibacter sp.]